MAEENRAFLQEQIEKVRQRLFSGTENLQKQEALEIIEDAVFSSGEELEFSEYSRIIKKIYALTRSKLGMLEPYLEDDTINEIMVNGKDCFFLEDSRGIRRIDDVFDTTEELSETLRPVFTEKSTK